MIRKLQNVYVVATNFDEAVHFYRDILGLRLKFQDDSRWAQFDLGNASFAVSAAGEGSSTPGAGAVVVFEVENLDAAMASLHSGSVPIEGGVADMGPHGRYFTVRDPAGNPIQLFQRAQL